MAGEGQRQMAGGEMGGGGRWGGGWVVVVMVGGEKHAFDQQQSVCTCSSLVFVFLCIVKCVKSTKKMAFLCAFAEQFQLISNTVEVLIVRWSCWGCLRKV